MKNKRFKIIKASGRPEAFSKKKLYRSIQRSGLPKKQCEKISNRVLNELDEGSNTNEIYRKTLNLIKETSPIAGVQYSLKKALFELGPEGHHFETFVARYFEEIGFEAETCVTLPGKFIKHEVDVVSSLNGSVFFTECKFHNHSGRKNDAKISLYVKARWDDLKAGPHGQHLKGFYIASNTAFSLDAMAYAKGTGLRLLGVNAPLEESFLDTIKKLKLYPLTSLRSLSKSLKKMLLAKNIVLAKDLLFHQNTLCKMGFSDQEWRRLEREILYLIRT